MAGVNCTYYLNGKKMSYGEFREEISSNPTFVEKYKLGSSSIPNNPLLKNWQELSIKRALQEAVDSGSPAWKEIMKPESVGEKLKHYLGSEFAVMSPLKVVDAPMLTALKNNKIRGVVVEFVPVNVVDVLSKYGFSADQLLSQPNVVGKILSVNDRATVARGLGSAFELARTRFRTALDRGFAGKTTRGDIKLLSTVNASDFSPREIVGLLSPDSIYGGVHNVRSSGSSGAGSSAILPKAKSDLIGIGRELPSTELAEILNRHSAIVSPRPSEVKLYEPDASYFSWINGEQTSARYNLATHLDGVKWENQIAGRRGITLQPKSGEKFGIVINEKGIITDAVKNEAWEGKKLDEVLGKGLADKIMEKESGTLSGEGLKFGGEWATNLYDKQVKNIVEDLTGGKVELLDMGLPIDASTEKMGIWVNSSKVKAGESIADSVKNARLMPEDLKVGMEINRSQYGARVDGHIITDILGDGKFKAIPKQVIDDERKARGLAGGLEGKMDLKTLMEDMTENGYAETFDISTKKTTQQGIKLTPEIKAMIRGEMPAFKASGNMYEVKAPDLGKYLTKTKQPTSSKNKSLDEFLNESISAKIK